MRVIRAWFFLTVDKQIADTQFRRQFLFQLIILLSHLLLFTKAEKQNWVSPKTRAFQMDFTLQPDDAKWVQDTLNRAFEEMRQTTPNGRVFAETVQTILERDGNWVRYKIDVCDQFVLLTLDCRYVGSMKIVIFSIRNHTLDHQQKKPLAVASR